MQGGGCGGCSLEHPTPPRASSVQRPWEDEACLPVPVPPRLTQWATLSVFACFEEGSETRSSCAAVCSKAPTQPQGTW